jgi:hypothetical protein
MPRHIRLSPANGWRRLRFRHRTKVGFPTRQTRDDRLRMGTNRGRGHRTPSTADAGHLRSVRVAEFARRVLVDARLNVDDEGLTVQAPAGGVSAILEDPTDEKWVRGAAERARQEGDAPENGALKAPVCSRGLKARAARLYLCLVKEYDAFGGPGRLSIRSGFPYVSASARPGESVTWSAPVGGHGRAG